MRRLPGHVAVVLFVIGSAYVCAMGCSGGSGGDATSSSSSSSSSGASGSSSSSGGPDASTPRPVFVCDQPALPAEKTFSQLSASEKQVICDYNACPFGGYGKSIECSSSRTVKSKDTLDECLAHGVFKRCADLTVGSYLACAQKVFADPCKTGEVISSEPSCEPFEDCMRNTNLDVCPRDQPVTSADIDMKYGWQPAVRTQGACTTEELTQFEDNLDDTSIQTWTGLNKNLSAGCAACLITSSAETDWGPIVWFSTGGGMTGFKNFGACYSIAEGSDACGKAIQYQESCLDIACDYCDSQGNRDDCIATVSAAGGTCKTFVDAVTTACPNLVADGKACADLVKAATVQCGP